MKWLLVILFTFIVFSEARKSLRQLRQFCYRTEDEWEGLVGAKYRRKDWFRWCKARGYLKPSRSSRHHHLEDDKEVPPGIPALDSDDILLEDRRSENDQKTGPSGNLKFAPINDDDKPMDGLVPDIAKPVTLGDDQIGTTKGPDIGTTIAAEIGTTVAAEIGTSIAAEIGTTIAAEMGTATTAEIGATTKIAELLNDEVTTQVPVLATSEGPPVEGTPGTSSKPDEVPATSDAALMISTTPGPRVVRSTQLSPPNEPKRKKNGASRNSKGKKKSEKLKRKGKEDFSHKLSLKGNSKGGKKGSNRKVPSTSPKMSVPENSSPNLTSTSSPDADLSDDSTALLPLDSTTLLPLDSTTLPPLGIQLPEYSTKCPGARNRKKQKKLKAKQGAAKKKDEFEHHSPKKNGKFSKLKSSKKSPLEKATNIKPKERREKQNRLKFHDTPKDGSPLKTGKEKRVGETRKDRPHRSKQERQPKRSQTKSRPLGKNKKMSKKAIRKEKSAKRLKSNHSGSSVTVRKGDKTIACSYAGVKSRRKMKAMCRKTIS